MWGSVTPSSSLLLLGARHWLSSLGTIAIGPLMETFIVLIIKLLQAMLDTETDFSQSGQVCNLAMLHKVH